MCNIFVSHNLKYKSIKSYCDATLSPIPLSPHQCSFGPCDYRVFLEGGKSASLCEGIRLFLFLPWWPHILRRLINWSLDVWQAFRAAANAASQIGRSCTVPEMKPVKTFPLWQEEVKISGNLGFNPKSDINGKSGNRTIALFAVSSYQIVGAVANA